MSLCKHCGANATSKCGSCHCAMYCSRQCQRNDWIIGHSVYCDLIQMKRGREETETYWANSGKYQNLLNFMLRTLEEVAAKDSQWYTRDKNKVLKFLNAMVGIYYAKYNDGDDIEGAIDNNRAHGIRDIYELKMLARTINAPADVRRFLDRPDDYERAIEKTILFVDEQAFQNKNRMMLEQTLRQLGLDRNAAESLADFHSRI